MDTFASSSGMTLEEIDRLLVAWRTNLSSCSQNLLALYDLHTFKRLKGDDGLPAATLTGVTAARVPAALDAVAKLFDNLQLLTNTIDQAERLRQNMPRLFASGRSRSQIEQLLTSNSITIPNTQTPLAQRGLLSDANQGAMIAPSRLLETMTRTFEQCRSVIMEVDTAWSRLEPALGAINDEAMSLAQTAATVSESPIPELETLRSRIKLRLDSIQNDPLGVNIDIDREFKPILESARTAVSGVARSRTEVLASIAQAHSSLDKLRQQVSEASSAVLQCRQRVFNPSGLIEPPAISAVDELQDWLASLEGALQQGHFSAVQVGISRWIQACSQAMDTCHRAKTAAQAPVDMIDELRGRLAAQKARARATAARGGATDIQLSALESEASQLLELNPTPVGKATLVVNEYERRVRLLPQV